MEKDQIITANLIRTIDELDSYRDLKQAANFLIRNICVSASWSYGEAWMRDIKINQMTWLTYWGTSKDIYKRFTKLSALCKFGKGVGLIGRVWEQQKLLWINDLKSDFNFLRTEAAELIGFNSAFGVPIFYKDDVILVLTFFLSNVKNEDVEISNILFNHSKKIGDKLSKLGVILKDDAK